MGKFFNPTVYRVYRALQRFVFGILTLDAKHYTTHHGSLAFCSLVSYKHQMAEFGCFGVSVQQSLLPSKSTGCYLQALYAVHRLLLLCTTFGFLII